MKNPAKDNFMVDALVAKLFLNSGERVEDDKRKFHWKRYTVIAENKSDALTKVGRKVTAEERFAKRFEFV